MMSSYMRRPGRLRLDYAPPATIQVYADGIWLIYVDTELEEVTHVPLGSSLAGFLVRETVSLSDDVTVTGVERRPGIVRIHLVQTKEPEAGTLIGWNAGASALENIPPPADGVDGTAVLNGSGAPSAGLGVDGDFYIDTADDAIYGPKTAGAWGSATSLVGPAGATGATGNAWRSYRRPPERPRSPTTGRRRSTGTRRSARSTAPFRPAAPIRSGFTWPTAAMP